MFENHAFFKLCHFFSPALNGYPRLRAAEKGGRLDSGPFFGGNFLFLFIRTAFLPAVPTKVDATI